jgi:hypothetical protein
MADWPDLHFRARLYAANDPDFIPEGFLQLVNLNGGHVGLCQVLELDPHDPAGQDRANFFAALIILCYELCAQGRGDVPYVPVPLIVLPQVAPEGGGAVNQPLGQVGDQAIDQEVQINADGHEDDVEIIGGFHPDYGPWLEDNYDYANDNDDDWMLGEEEEEVSDNEHWHESDDDSSNSGESEESSDEVEEPFPIAPAG